MGVVKPNWIPTRAR